MNLDTVTHRNTNRARRRLTLLIEISVLPLGQTTTWWCGAFGTVVTTASDFYIALLITGTKPDQPRFTIIRSGS